MEQERRVWTALVNLTASHIYHVAAVLVAVSMFGAGRLTFVARQTLGPQWLSQAALLIWASMLIAGVYLVPGMAMFAVGMAVPLFADNYVKASMVAHGGTQLVEHGAVVLLREKGPAGFMAIASVGHVLRAALAWVLISVSGGRATWSYWLGCGMLAAAGLGFVTIPLYVRRVRAEQSNEPPKQAA
jgi:hypothetical protein